MAMAQSFLASEATPAAADTAAWHVIPVPYEYTVSYGSGTADGPQAILEASQQLEAYLEGVGVPCRNGIHTAPAPDLSGGPEDALAAIRTSVANALACNAIPVVLGGEHTVTYAAVAALAAAHKTFGIVQFDAHADLRETYEGTTWSHACVTRKIIEELNLPVCQIGVRSLCEEEIAARQAFNIHALDASAIARGRTLDGALPEQFPDKVYITFDVDAFDAALMPATGTPEPGGLDWWTAVSLLQQIAGARTIIGCDVVELAPIPTLHHCNYTAAKLAYLLMGLSAPRPQ